MAGQSELNMAKGMKANGYQYAVQFKAPGKSLDVIYFKQAMDVGPFMRDTPSLTMVWNKKIDDFITELEQEILIQGYVPVVAVNGEKSFVSFETGELTPDYKEAYCGPKEEAQERAESAAERLKGIASVIAVNGLGNLTY